VDYLEQEKLKVAVLGVNVAVAAKQALLLVPVAAAQQMAVEAVAALVQAVQRATHLVLLDQAVPAVSVTLT
jgi:hypothetical protein